MSLLCACADSRSALQITRPDNGGSCHKAKRKQPQLSVIYESVWQTIVRHRTVQGRCRREHDSLQSLLIKDYRQIDRKWIGIIPLAIRSLKTHHVGAELEMALAFAALARDKQSILAPLKNLVGSSRRKAWPRWPRLMHSSEFSTENLPSILRTNRNGTVGTIGCRSYARHAMVGPGKVR